MSVLKKAAQKDYTQIGEYGFSSRNHPVNLRCEFDENDIMFLLQSKTTMIIYSYYRSRVIQYL